MTHEPAKNWYGWLCVLALMVLSGAAAAGSRSDSCPRDLVLAIPERSSGADSGTDVARKATALDRRGREELIRSELFAGNVPQFLRHLIPVHLSGKGVGGKKVEVTLCVAPDYAAVGSDSDFLRVPMGLDTALSFATRFGFVLPTRAMVDAIYEQSSAHLDPEPMTPGAQMTSTDYYVRHNRGIDQQRRSRDIPLGALLAGHKKDLVLTGRLRSNPGRVAIYGWHRSGGRPIQPLSTVHGAGYADYSHGVRLVSATIYVNGEPRSIFDALEDPDLAALLSDEGPIANSAGLVVDNGGRNALLKTAGIATAFRDRNS